MPASNRPLGGLALTLPIRLSLLSQLQLLLDGRLDRPGVPVQLALQPVQHCTIGRVLMPLLVLPHDIRQRLLGAPPQPRRKQPPELAVLRSGLAALVLELLSV